MSVLVALAARGLQAVAQLGILGTAAVLLSPAEQGWLVTARSLLGLQVVLELGFSGVLVQVVAHEWARPETDSGKPARIGGILRFAMRWYLGVALLLVVVVGMAGTKVFSGRHLDLSWQGPWLIGVAMASMGVVLLPLQAVLEGSGRVSSMALYKGVQAVAGSAGLAMLAGLSTGLWSLLGLVGAPILVGWAWFLLWHRADLQQAWNAHPEAGINWRREILPFQWRIAVSWASGWLIFQLYMPVLFCSQGPVAAGQMGLSLEACTGITAIGMAWISIKAPAWGRLIALGRFEELDQQFLQAWRRSGLAVVSAAGFFLGLILLLRQAGVGLAGRFLPTPDLVIVVAAGVLNHSVFAMASYLRAHKREPFLITSVVGAALLAGWALSVGPRLGTLGFAVVNLVVTVVVGLGWGGWIFAGCRRKWHQEPSSC